PVCVEKEQGELLARFVLELLSDLSIETPMAETNDDEQTLEEPVDPRWRAGRLSIGFDHAEDQFLLEIDEYIPEPEDDELEGFTPEPDSITLWASREQMLALSRHG